MEEETAVVTLPLGVNRRTGSASWPQLMKVTSWVTRPNVRWTICCERPSSIEISSGDNGVDIEGLFRKHFVVIQCKNYRGSVGVAILRDLEAVLSRSPKNTIGILVIPCKSKYTIDIKKRVKKSMQIILTDQDNICVNLLI
nr:1174_t:CDS:2 [Entrophospora candida]